VELRRFLGMRGLMLGGWVLWNDFLGCGDCACSMALAVDVGVVECCCCLFCVEECFVSEGRWGVELPLGLLWLVM